MKSLFRLAFFLTPLLALSSTTPDFRTLNWGMAREQIRAAEDAEFVKESVSGFTYNDTILNEPTRIYYLVDERGLYEASCWFDEIPTPQRFISFRAELEQTLRTKYGEPIKDHEYWDDYIYFDDPENHWRALFQGQVFYLSRWQTHTTLIDLSLANRDNEIVFYILYEPLKSSNNEI